MEMPMADAELKTVLLGLEPYILIRITGDPEGDDESVDTTVEFGGGFDRETGIGFLKAVIESAEENGIG